MFRATLSVVLLLVSSVAAAGPFVFPPDAGVGVQENKPVDVRWTANKTSTKVKLTIFQRRGSDEGGYAERILLETADDPGSYNWTPVPLDGLPFGFGFPLHFNLKYGEDADPKFNSGPVFIKNPEKVATPPASSSAPSSSTTQNASKETTSPAQETTEAASTSTPESVDSSSDNELMKVGLGVGLGIGIPFLIILGVGVWFYFFYHRRRLAMASARHDFSTPSSQYGWSVSSQYPKAELEDNQAFSPGGGRVVDRKSQVPPAPKELPAEIP